MAPRKRDRRKLGSRNYKNYSDEMLSIAVDMIRTKKMTSYDAEKVYGIPRRTLERKVKNTHMNKPGPPFKLTEQEEMDFVKVLIVLGDYGAPMTLLDLRIVVYEYLLKNNKAHIFDGKLPGEWWARAFIERHRDKLTTRSVQNIKRARAEKTVTELKNYFENLKEVVKDVPATNMVNYDETNFSDNPGSVKCIFRRGIKHPERIMNSTKGCISVMFAGTANGEVLPPYVVYKSEGLWTKWVEGGPSEARYNRTKSGWFDSSTFFDWFTTIIVPWARKLEGTKLIIGDNLSSHINLEVIELCEKYDIKFVLLPPNSTHITQPLDVAFFGPLKKTWRKILTNYKIENPRQAALNKCHFPPLLKKVMDEVNMSKKDNIVSGFKAAGICPFNPKKVLSKVPEYNDESDHPQYSVDQVLLDYLRESRKPNEMKRGKRKKLSVEAGMSISISDIIKNTEETESDEEKTKKKKKRVKKINKNENTDQISTGKKKFEIDVKTDEFTTGLQTNIAVKVCGNLSDNENSNDDKENMEASCSGQNKQRKRNKKTMKAVKKNKKPRAYIISSSSEESTDISMSIHSDSDIIDIPDDSSDLPFCEDDDDNIVRSVDDIEATIFQEIAKRDQDLSVEKHTDEMDNGSIKGEEVSNNGTDHGNTHSETSKGMEKPCFKENEVYLTTTQKKEYNVEESIVFRSTKEKVKAKKEVEETDYLCDSKINERGETEEIQKRNTDIEDKENPLDKRINDMKSPEKYEEVWNVGDSVIVGYYIRNNWKYFIGIIEAIDHLRHIYTIVYYKTLKKDRLLFVKKGCRDSDLVPYCNIVKKVSMVEIKKNPDTFILSHTEDSQYFL